MTKTLSKSQFKPRMLALLREVEESGEALILTDHGRPVVKIEPIHSVAKLDEIQEKWAKKLREGRVHYDPETATAPLPSEAWGELA
ncbi:MAG: type II toxin-antitoxin system Phd/YefM family antitoxin [Planctomycetota bacterium]|nr:MAG: type II toxin-antitoxin system Phd/YefM family antitoxin [Planctomycetota bacterium]